MNRPRRVFISSTITDLVNYRQAVIDVIRQIGLEAIVSEVYSASLAHDQPLEAIRQILEAADIFVLILGYKYGPIIPELGKSPVEVEYDLAREMEKPILAYMIGEDTPIPISAIDRDLARIQSFREQVARERVVKFFSTPTDLASGVLQGIVNFIERQRETPEKRPPPEENTENE